MLCSVTFTFAIRLSLKGPKWIANSRWPLSDAHFVLPVSRASAVPSESRYVSRTRPHAPAALSMCSVP